MIMPNVGVMQFLPVESFADPARGLAPDAKVDKLLQDILEERPSKAQITASWPQVYEAIRRGGLFVVEANTPAFRAMLRFDPDRPGVGDYEIHHQPRPHVERGRIEKVKPVAADERHPGLSMLTQFATRFIVFSVGLARPHTRMVWLVGLSEFRTVDEGDPA